jgi:hypothetical protein
MPSPAQIARKAQYDAAKAERALKPKIERVWVQIREVPEHVQSPDARTALQYLINKADKVEMMQFPKDASQYQAYFDDGVFKGCFVFKWTENGLNPLNVYERLRETNWPGYSLSWMKDAARERMTKELNK